MKIKSIFSLRKWVGLFCEQKIARKISDKTQADHIGNLWIEYAYCVRNAFEGKYEKKQ